MGFSFCNLKQRNHFLDEFCQACAASGLCTAAAGGSALPDLSIASSTAPPAQAPSWSWNQAMSKASALDEQNGVCICATRTGHSVGLQPRSIGKALPLPCVKHPEQMQSDRERVTGLGRHRGGEGDNQTLFLPVQCLPKTPECLTEVAAE